MLIDISNWGSRPEERALVYACDRWLPYPQQTLYRALTIKATCAQVFRWLCQIKVAPYSYDWVDNLGRQSPRRLIPGCERLTLGEKFNVFTLIDFEVDKHITIEWRHPFLGRVILNYAILERGDHCRLVGKLLINYPPGPLGWLARLILPLGDLIMMRRQLLNFKELAEAP